MAYSENERKATIGYIVANCDCWQDPSDRDTLNGFTDEKLLKMKARLEKDQQAIAVANAAVNGFADGNGNAFRINPETGKWEKRVIPSQTANAKKPEDMDEDEWDAMSEEEQEEYVEKVNKKRMMGKEGEESTENYRQREKKPRTMEDWVRSAPNEVQNTFRYAQQIEQREKDKIIAEILVNVSDSEKQAHRERLQRRSLDELHNDLAIMPKLPPKEEPREKVTNQRQRQRSDSSSEDMLVMPKISWEEVGGEGQTPGMQPVSVENSEHLSDLTEDDWLKTAPSNIRSRVMNAMVIEERERRKLVDELTANVSDEDAEKRLRGRLMSKSIEELKDLISLAPRRESSKPNYFGSSAPLGNLAPRPNEANEDVLPLPTINWAEEAASSKKRQA